MKKGTPRDSPFVNGTIIPIEDIGRPPARLKGPVNRTVAGPPGLSKEILKFPPAGADEPYGMIRKLTNDASIATPDNSPISNLHGRVGGKEPANPAFAKAPRPSAPPDVQMNAQLRHEP